VAGFPNSVMDSVDRIVEASLVLYEDVSKKFLPSAVKFTYNWSLRELTNIFQGICMMRNGEYNNAMDVTRIWIHEFGRVISDRFFNISGILTVSYICIYICIYIYIYMYVCMNFYI
jgi:dynein heavy chain